MYWQEMEEFGREYIKHDDFLFKFPRITDDTMPSKLTLPSLPTPATQYEAGRRKRAQAALCSVLGLPNNKNGLMRRIASFQRWLYLEVCKRVRACLLRGQPPAAVLDAAPEWVRFAVNALQLLPIALKKETKYLEKEGAATAIVSSICDAWEALRARAGAGGGPCAPGCACAGGCDECRSDGTPPRAALRAAARQLLVDDTDALLQLWVSYRNVALGKLRALAAAGDDARRVPPAARPSAADWRVIDLALLHDDSLQLLTEESVTHNEQLQPLIMLFSVVQQHGLHAPEPPAGAGADAAWRAAHGQLADRGSSVSLVVLQRRWHELCGAARARVLALRRAGAARPTLPPLYQAVVRRYPEVVMRPQRSWRELVDAGLVHTDVTAAVLELAPWPRAAPPPPPGQPDNEDDIILIEKNVEVIELRESDGETDEGNGDNAEANVEAQEVKCATSLDGKGLQQAIRKEIQNHREFLQNDVVNLLERNTVNQNDQIMDVGENDHIVEATSTFKDSSSNALAVKGFFNKNLKTSNVTDASIENNLKDNTIDNTSTTQGIINTSNTSSLNSLDTGQQLDILQKINPESSEALIIFDDDDSDEANKQSDDENGITEDVVKNNEASVDLQTKTLATNIVDNEDSKCPNKDDSNILVQSLNLNKELSTVSPQLVIETLQVVTESPVPFCKSPDTITPINPAEGLNINKKLVSESSALAPNSTVLARESIDTVVSVIPAENLNINKGRVSKIPEVTGSSDSIVAANQADSVHINKEIDLENSELATTRPEPATLNPDTENPCILVESPILNGQETTERPAIKYDTHVKRLNINKEANAGSSENLKSSETDAVQNFSVIDKNIIQYKTKLKSERVDNVEVGDSYENSVSMSVIDLFRKNLGQDLDITSENIPKINNMFSIASIETKTESEISCSSNSNDMKMVVQSNDDESERKGDSGRHSDEADSSSMDTADVAPEIIDPKLLMTPSIPLQRLERTHTERAPLLVEDRSTHPDFNARLKGLSSACLSTNWQLLQLCRPLSVNVERLPRGLLDRYLGGGRPARRVHLPDIEEVRRANRRLLCAQVAPTPLPVPRLVPIDAGPARAPPAVAAGAGAELTEEELMALLQRCEPPAARRGNKAQYCCLARRHRAYNDARRRLATNAHRPPPADIDLHGARHRSAECECCCVHLVRGAADGELARRLARRLRRLEGRAARLLRLRTAAPDDNKEESEDDEDDVAYISKPAPKKKRYEQKKGKKTKKKEKEKNVSPLQNSDGYQEWIRQKNLTTKYFHINAYPANQPDINAIGDESKQKQKTDKPNTDGQTKTDVATTAADNSKNDALAVHNKYVARVFGSKVNKEDHAKLSQEANAECMKVMSYISTSGQRIIKLCKPLDEPKKCPLLNRKRKSLGDIVEDIPNKITIRVPSQTSMKVLGKSQSNINVSNEDLRSGVETPHNNNVNVEPTVSQSSEVVKSSIERNQKVSDNPSLSGPQTFVKLNPLKVKVLGPVNSGSATPLNILNQSANRAVIGAPTESNTSGQKDTNVQGENLESGKGAVDSVQETKQLPELNDDSDDDTTDKLFIDETVQKSERTESQNSNESKATLVSSVNKDVGQCESENNSKSDKNYQNQAQNASPGTDSNIGVKVKTDTIASATTSNIFIHEMTNETESPNVAEKVNTNQDDPDTNQNNEQNYISDEELKTLPVKKVYQKLVRPNNKSESGKLIGTIKIHEVKDSGSHKPAANTKDHNASNEKLNVTKSCHNTNATVSKETCTEVVSDGSDDDIQIIEPSGAASELRPRSLLVGSPRGRPSGGGVQSEQRPPTLLEQIAQMHQAGKKFVIKKIDESAPILYHSPTNLNKVSRYVELFPETKAKPGPPQIFSQPPPGAAVNLNQQLARRSSPAPPAAASNAQQSEALTLGAAEAAQILHQNAQISPQSQNACLNASNLILKVSPERLTLTKADDSAAAGGAGGSLEVLPRISDVTSLAGPARAARTIAVASVSTQSEHTAAATSAAEGAGRRARAWRLSALPPLRAQRFVRHRDPTDIAVLCIDAARPPMRLAEGHLLVTEMEIPSARATYWTVASDKKTRMLCFEQPSASPAPGAPAPATDAAQNDSQTDTGTGAGGGGAEQRGGLKVKSFAKLAQANALEPGAPPAAPAPSAAPLDLVRSGGKLYKKMTDQPLIYARVLHVVPDLQWCRRALAAGAALGLRAPHGRVMRVLRAPPAGRPASTGLRCDAALPALTDLVSRLNQEATDVISLDSDDE